MPELWIKHEIKLMAKVTKCICHDRSFEEIKEYARENGIDNLKTLQEQKICSCGCQMCAPYVELMLETGKTAFVPGEPYGRKKKNER